MPLQASIRNYLQKRTLRKSQKAKKDEPESSNRSECTGSLDSRQQLENAFQKLFKNEGVEEAWRRKFFQKVRILAVGRSGVGKTTLIRLMVGEHGPQSISEDDAGVQDINKEFIYSSSKEQDNPLIIHDSNGVDVKGKARVDEIEAFLDKHKKSDDFAEHVHIIWYVISAIDPRCVEDGDVMKMIRQFKIPLLLIMTHCDYEKPKVTDKTLNKLLQGYGEEGRENVKKEMVRVGNDGVSMGENNELIFHESKRDVEGLKLVAKRTRKLIDKRLRNTWVAAQAVDIDGKLDKCAGLIAGYARTALFTSLPRAIPLADPLKLTIIFYRVVIIMCQIWVVPPQLKKALKETLLHKEGGCRVLRRIGEDLVYVARLAYTLGATVLTAGIALPSVIAVLGGSKGVPVLVKTFSLQVLATILYVRCTQVASSPHGWKPSVSKEAYLELCEDFAHNEKFQAMLVNFGKENHSILDLALRKKKVKGFIKSKILRTYQRLLKDRPNSLNSLMKLEDEDEDEDEDKDKDKDSDSNSDSDNDNDNDNSNVVDYESMSSKTKDDGDLMEQMGYNNS